MFGFLAECFTIGDLCTLDHLWMRAYKMACRVSQSMSHVFYDSPELGGRNLTPLAVSARLSGESCCFRVVVSVNCFFWNTRKC
jgi:hypothetical protein